MGTNVTRIARWTALAILPAFFMLATASADSPEWIGGTAMNGLSLQDYAGFQKDWKLVTVRYRTDSAEFRFTYANPAAWKTLSEGKTDYPDGAVFAKVAYRLGTDRSFPSSLMPNEVSRYQLMLKSKKKYAETAGWGYALFGPNGRVSSGDQKNMALACAACHGIVKNRGFVFSMPIQSPFTPPALVQGGLRFADSSVRKLPERFREVLPRSTEKLRILHGPVSKFTFEGTLNEIRPFLAEEALRSSRPAVLLSTDQKHFVAVFRDNSANGDSGCKSPNGEGKNFAFVMTAEKSKGAALNLAYAEEANANGFASGTFCYAAGR
jgi:hypothetical protein